MKVIVNQDEMETLQECRKQQNPSLCNTWIFAES